MAVDQITGGYNVTQAKPVDNRTKVATLSLLPNINKPYVGLLVYVEDEDKIYKVQSLDANGKIAEKAVFGEGGGIPAGGITASDIAADAVETAKIKDGAVTASKIANDAISTGKIEDGAVTSDKIANGAVDTDQIADGAVTEDKLDAALKNKIDGKVDAVAGKGLSTNDYTTADKEKLSALPTNASLTTSMAGKVDKETGKGLSTNDYTNDEKTKLAGLPNATALAADLALKADKASPALTGVPTAPTAAAGTNTQQIATTAFVGTAVEAEATARTSAIAAEESERKLADTTINSRILNLETKEADDVNGLQAQITAGVATSGTITMAVTMDGTTDYSTETDVAPSRHAVQSFVKQQDAQIQTEVDEIALKTEQITSENIYTTDSEVVITDDNDNEIVKIDESGLDAISLKQNGLGVLTEDKIQNEIESTPSQTKAPTSKAVADYVKANGLGDTPITNVEVISGEEGGEFIVQTDDGEDVLKVTKDALFVKKILGLNGEELTDQKYKGKTFAFYGDSITHQCSGDFSYPFVSGQGAWAGMIANDLALAKYYGRGVGGQTYKWNDNCFYTKRGSTGNYDGRYKVVDGATTNIVLKADATAEEISAIESQKGYSIELHRGCFCSWDRITSMFPSSIKGDIDIVFIMGGTNDFNAVEETQGGGTDAQKTPQWSASNTTDQSWSSSALYNGGDFDVSNTWGAMASTIMKFGVWMPNAKIIILAPITRKGVSFNCPINNNGYNQKQLTDDIINVACYCNVDSFNLFGDSGIHQFNADNCLSDGIHPNSLGHRLMANCIISKL